MSVIILLAPAQAKNATFVCPSGNAYLSDTNGLIPNVSSSDLQYMESVGARVLAPRNNVAASIAPNASNDVSQLYDTGSLWINGATQNVYLCTTGFPLGSAIWILLATGITATLLGALTGQVTQIGAPYTVAPTDIGKTIECLAGDYTVIVPAANNFVGYFQAKIINPATAINAPLLNIAGFTPFRVWPGQSYEINSDGGTAWLVSPAPGQPYVNTSAAGVIYYVDNAGSDSNSGLGSGPSQALLTPQAAIELSFKTSHLRKVPQIFLALNQTYNVGAGLNITYVQTGGVQMFITGQTGVNLPNVILNCTAGGNCIIAREPATVTISGVQFTTSGNASVAVSVSQFATIDLEGGFAFGNFPLGAHVSLVTSASVNFLSNYEVYSNVSTHLTVASNSYCNYGSFTCVLPNNLVFSNWVVVATCGFVNSGGVAMGFSGPGAGGGSTGGKYNVTSNANLNIAGGVFPGSVGGVTGTGGNVF